MSSQNARTGTPFSDESCRIRSAMYSDCAGEPPGELMTITTALTRSVSKARLNIGSTESMVIPRPAPTCPMTPSRRTTATLSARDFWNFLTISPRGPFIGSSLVR